jgi:hypothetical protein
MASRMNSDYDAPATDLSDTQTCMDGNKREMNNDSVTERICIIHVCTHSMQEMSVWN